MKALYEDPVAIRRRRANDVLSASVPSGHHMAEEAPEALAEILDRSCLRRMFPLGPQRE